MMYPCKKSLMRTLNYITVILVLNSKVDQCVFHKVFFFLK